MTDDRGILADDFYGGQLSAPATIIEGEGAVPSTDSLAAFGGDPLQCVATNKSKGARCTNQARKGQDTCFGHRRHQ